MDFHNEGLFGSSFSQMEQLFKMKHLCDITVKVDDDSLLAHKIILAGVSQYFMSMFTVGMVESKLEEITITGVRFSALQDLVNYAYNGKVHIDNHNVQDLFEAASFLQIMEVRKACEDFLASNINERNVLGIRKFAESLSCPSLLKVANELIYKKFKEICRTYDFMTLEIDELIDIIKQDDLIVEKEEVVYDAVVKWVKYDKEKREIFFESIFEYIRLPLLDLNYLNNNVLTEELVNNSRFCLNLLEDAKNSHLCPERREILKRVKTRHRADARELYVVGDNNWSIEIYNPFNETWQKADLIFTHRSGFGVTALKGKLYILGGFRTGRTSSLVEIYNPKTKIWSKGPDMLHTREWFGVDVLNDNIYVCGGRHENLALNSVERFCLKSNNWKAVKPMRHNRLNCETVALNGYLYVIGGEDEVPLSSVERYNPETETWIELCPMIFARTCLGAAALNDKIYVCGGLGAKNTVEVYDPKTNRWSLINSMNVERCSLIVCAYMNKLWAIGGNSDYQTTVEIYDPSQDEWTLSSMVLDSKLKGGSVVI